MPFYANLYNEYTYKKINSKQYDSIADMMYEIWEIFEVKNENEDWETCAIDAKSKSMTGNLSRLFELYYLKMRFFILFCSIELVQI